MAPPGTFDFSDGAGGQIIWKSDDIMTKHTYSIQGEK
jgi:hypothetical protein